MDHSYDGNINNNSVRSKFPMENDTEHCLDIKEFLWDHQRDVTSLPPVMALFALIYSAIIITSVMGNLLVVASVYRYRSLQSVRNMFIAALSVSDIFVSIVSGTITPISAFSKIWLFGELLCKLVPLIQGMSLCFSTLTLSAISIDRFRLIVMPLRQSIQRHCACRIVAMNAGFALAISLPMLFTQKLDSYDRFCGQFCAEDWGENGKSARSAYGTFVFIAQFAIPFLTISTSYVLISIKINSGIMAKRASTEITKYNDMTVTNGTPNIAVKRASGSGGPEESPLLAKNGGATNDVMQMAMEQKKATLNRRLRTNRMLIAMVAVFFCCWAPSVMFNFLRDNQWLPNFVLQQEYLFGIITHCISMSSTIWNPVLYALLNEQFRSAFTEQFKQLRQCSGWRVRTRASSCGAQLQSSNACGAHASLRVRLQQPEQPSAVVTTVVR